MSASSKFDLSSGSPDRPLYTSGHRSSYDANLGDRSGSFREDLESPLLSFPNMSRSGLSPIKGDILHFFNCLRFDPKLMVAEHKLNRPSEFKKWASAAVGIPLEDSLPASSNSKQMCSRSLEELRRLKSGVRECGTKARERLKIFNDCLSVYNKCFPSNSPRKRSRLDTLFNDRSNTLLSVNKPHSRMGSDKLGTQNFAGTSGLDLLNHKSEEMTKNVPPSKRARTSMMSDKVDIRPKTGPTGTVSKERGVIRLSNSFSIRGEDQTVSTSVGCWENPKTKKKRTRIKPDAATSLKTKPVDGYWEPKQGRESWVSTEASPRLTDARGFRSRIANGGAGVGKAEVISHTSSGIHLPTSRAPNSNSTLNVRREHPTGQEKEVVDPKALNKENSQEDFSSGSPTSGSKLNTNIRAPRSSSIGRSQKAQCSPSSTDWEVSNCTSKIPSVPGSRKCKPRPVQSSSPPVASWVQRPQKIVRTARRNNSLSIFPGNEENPVTDVTPAMVVNGRHFSANSSEQVKIKSANFSPATLSESEESGSSEHKFQNASKGGSEINEKGDQNVQRISTSLPTRKKKPAGKHNHGDGIRRKGRTVRGFTSSRSVIPPTVEKIESLGTTKRMRTARLGPVNTERSGRLPPRKPSDRKANTWHNHIPVNVMADFLDCSDNGHKELLAATNTVINPGQTLSSPFWKKMEPLFRFICDADITYLKEQVNLRCEMDMSVPPLLDADSSNFLPNGFEFESDGIDMGNVEVDPELAITGTKTSDGISLYQRVVAAIIPEEENEEAFDVGKEVNKYDIYGSQLHAEIEKESNALLMSQDYPMEEGNAVRISEAGYVPMHDGLMADCSSGTACSEYQYMDMPMNERLLLEIHSIGIFPDLVSDSEHGGDEGISKTIYGLQEMYHEQVSKNKSLHGELLSHVTKAKDLQETELKGRANDKLVEIAYQKYMSCLVSNAPGTKNANTKLVKQATAAADFVNWTLRHYKEFEATGKSSFDEPVYRDIFISGVSRLADEIPSTSNTEDESDKLHSGKPGCSIEVRTSAPLQTEQSPSSNNQEIHSSEMLVTAGPASEPNTDKGEMWPGRVKRRELLLDDVGGSINISSNVSSGLGGSLSPNVKGKRSERDRAGKGRKVLNRSGNAKIGRPASSTGKGERKNKTKPKPKIAHLSASLNGPEGKISDQSKVSKSGENVGTDIGKNPNEYDPDTLEDPIDLSALRIPDDLMDPNDNKKVDLGSWFNFEDDELKDHDFSCGLEIPTDNLADLDMQI
ncbi:uncharacterized protein LOC127263393 isoform X2 [Andrographis paniculata]|uniref:uncharacterized protein LOC127263393 isoform X2 n=1 Tax=Andrographis paniculata TaxID=175694 RepID=UPI0021E90D24|nr:uncharacterized protein LOC127263393 isoform X2 [Andrographis paniculata]